MPDLPDGYGAGGVGLQIESVLVGQRGQLRVVDHHPDAGLLGQLLQHVVVLVQEQLHRQT